MALLENRTAENQLAKKPVVDAGNDTNLIRTIMPIASPQPPGPETRLLPERAAAAEPVPDSSVPSLRPEDTVSGRLETILGSGSPLLQQARARAVQYANRRGLQNSLMAATAGESALIEQSLPIAQADAAASAQLGREALLQGRQFGQERLIQGRQFEQEQSLQEGQFAQQRFLQSEEIRAKAALSAQEHEQALAVLDKEFLNNSALLDQEYGHRATEGLRTELANLQGTLLANISAVLQNTDMSPQQREAAIYDLQRIAMEQMRAHYALAGLQDELNFDIEPAGPIGEGTTFGDLARAQDSFEQELRGIPASDYRRRRELVEQYRGRLGDDWARDQLSEISRGERANNSEYNDR